MIYKIWQLSKSYQIRFSHMSFPFIPCMADGAFEMKTHYVQKTCKQSEVSHSHLIFMT